MTGALTDPLIVTGAVRAAIWFYGAYLAWKFRRVPGILGFTGMAVVTVLNVIGLLQAERVSSTSDFVTTILATPVAFCLVHGYRINLVRESVRKTVADDMTDRAFMAELRAQKAQAELDALRANRAAP